MKPSLKQIAAQAGFSFQAVSQALNGTGALKGATRSHILEVARRMGYRPNGFARAIRTGRFGNVGLLLSTVKLFSYLDDEFLDGVHDALSERNYHLTVSKLPDAELTSGERVPKLLREMAVDGLLVNYTHSIPRDMIRLLKAHGVPSIWVNSKQNADCVYPDDAAAAASYDRIWDAAQGAVLAQGGVVSHHHGGGMSKQRFLIQQLGEAGVLASAVKKAFDPRGLFNPGKLGTGMLREESR